MATPSTSEVMLDAAINIVQQALDAIIAPNQPLTAENEERTQKLRKALENLLALKGSGKEDEILRATQPILAAASREPVGMSPIVEVQRKAAVSYDEDASERETKAVANQVAQGFLVSDLTQLVPNQVSLIQRQAQAIALPFGPPGWAIAAAATLIGIGIVYMTSRSRTTTRGREWVEPTTRQPPPPPPDVCHTAIKILTRYERLARDRGLNIPEKRLAELNRLRDAGEITINHLLGTLHRQFPGQFADMTLAAIRALCRM